MTYVEIDLESNSVIIEPGAPLVVKQTDVSDIQVITPGGPPGPPGPTGPAGVGVAVAMSKVSTYYSYPTSVNGSAPKVDAAASAAMVFSAYDEVIFGAGLQQPGHIVYEGTRRTIELLRGYGTRVWGYIDTEAVPGNDLAGVKSKIADWKAIGAQGIFCDKFGFDYNNDRSRQNEVIDAIHEAGLPAIVNVWNMADAFDPAFGMVHVTVGDVLYLESFTANTEAYLAPGADGYATLSDMKARAETAHGYQATYGFDIWVSNIVERSGLPELDRLNFFRQCEAAARIFRADGMTIDSGYYSSAYADSATVDQFTYSFDIGEPIHRDGTWEMSPDWHAIAAGDLGLAMHHYVGEGYTVTETEPQEVEHVKISGGTMYGPLVLSADPVADLEAATKQYVDGATGGGLDQATADSLYVNVSGDTMSGRLVAGEIETRNVRNDGILVYPWGDASAQGAIVPVVAGAPQTYSSILFYGNQWHVGTQLALPGDPVAATDAATKAYVDGKPAGGSLILSGTATPTAGTGAVGNYYLDTDDRVLYGPKAAPGLGPRSYVVPNASQTTTAGDDDAGMPFQFSGEGYVTGVRFQITPAAVPYTGWIVSIFGATSTALATKTVNTVVTGWNEVTFDAPVAVTPGVTYMVAYYTPVGAVIEMSNLVYPGQSSGGVIGLSQAAGGGYFYSSSAVPGTKPATPWAGHTAAVSPVFSATWPVALKSPPPGGTTGQVLKKLSDTDFDWGWVT